MLNAVELRFVPTAVFWGTVTWYETLCVPDRPLNVVLIGVPSGSCTVNVMSLCVAYVYVTVADTVNVPPGLTLVGDELMLTVHSSA